MRAALWLAAALAGAVLAPPARADDAPPARADDAPPARDFALSGCRVETCDGAPIDDGVVLVRGGRIEAVGARADVTVPPGVRVVEAHGRVVTPAFVDVASRIGLRGNGGGSDGNVAPTRTLDDELNPWLEGNDWAAANGFATLGLLPGQGIVGGRGLAVRAAAPDVESMVRRKDALLRVDVTQGARFVSTLAGQLSIARKDLDGLAKWEREHADWEQAKAKAEADKKPVPSEPKKPDMPGPRDAYYAVLRGETALYCRVGSSADAVSLREALSDETVRGERLRLYCEVSGDSYRAASELLDMGATCVVPAGFAAWRGTDQTIAPAVLLRNAGLRVVLQPRDDGRGGLRNFPVDLGLQVSAGFPRADVLRAATADAAALLGLEKETGRVAAGLRADLLLWSGDPLHATTRLLRVWIDGDPVEETP